MAEQFSELSSGLMQFIEKQRIFFVGTARSTGSVNVSPKGMESFHILNSKQIVWLNLTGSGNESAAHILENNRMTIMFCSFEKKPLILRLYGKAEAIHPRDKDWEKYAALFPKDQGSRQFFVLDIELVQTSCGFSVPFYEFVDDRYTLQGWAEKKGPEGIKDYWTEKNQQTIDGFETGIFDGR